MKNMTLRQMAAACGGALHEAAGAADREVSALVTDSRKAGEGCVFAAIRGARADGHDFIPDVFAKGALGVICEEEPADAAGSYILVPSTGQALKDIAEAYLATLHIPVVGITGSVGKTSTKEMIASVLAQKYKVGKTQGNFNNELGLPLTIFSLPDDAQIAVLEMGISDFGEMHRLAKIARPDICVITNIGQCHLEFLGTRDGILKAKTEIFDFLKPDGRIILNGNDDKLAGIREAKGIKPLFFGIPGQGGAELGVWAEDIEDLGLAGTACRICWDGGSIAVKIPVPGLHIVMNALAAAAVGFAAGLSPEQIRDGIAALVPVRGRFRILRTGRYTLIDDCYNANPVSMKASLQALSGADGRKVAVLGDMGELGTDEVQLHEETGTFAGDCGLSLLVTIGPLSVSIGQKAVEKDPGLAHVHFSTVDEFLKQAGELIREGDTVLVKASHFMGFDRIVEELQ